MEKMFSSHPQQHQEYNTKKEKNKKNMKKFYNTSFNNYLTVTFYFILLNFYFFQLIKYNSYNIFCTD